ncbi:uncharacterized protein [Drosophila tropicalis]|uniref:uncharacterized protein n=1 Tax=Drosophila tropicalis TaxID=46794 RepID=UPI0035AB712A
MMRLILLSSAVLLALNLGIANGQCQITQPMVEGTTRIFMLRDRNRRLSLKRTVSSAINEVLQMYCSATDIVATTCLQTRVFQPRLPQTCRAPPVAIVQPVQDRSCPHTMFMIGYRAGNQFLELYRACFDTRAVRAVFVTHRVYAKPFFPRRPCVRFSTDGVIGQADEASYTVRSIHATFRATFGNNQQFIPNNRDVVINRGHLAASADFLFGDQMCATFKYVNVVPQFASINDRNWEAIERWVRNSVRGNQFVDVRTGATGILTLRVGQQAGRQVYLNGRRNPVPEWMYKRVDNPTTRRTVVFLTYNNIFASQRPPAPRFCRAVNCPIQLPNTARDGFTFCCDPATFNP